MSKPSASARWWSRTRGVPPAAYDSWLASIASRPGTPARILAWADATEGVALGSPAVLSVGLDGSWTHIGWHEIERGGWNAERQALSWTLHADPASAARHGSVGLPNPGRLPELFRERVSASIVFEQFVPLAGERGVIISARRDLGGGEVTWHSTLTRGLSWQVDGVRAAADDAVRRLRTEFDVG